MASTCPRQPIPAAMLLAPSQAADTCNPTSIASSRTLPSMRSPRPYSWYSTSPVQPVLTPSYTPGVCYANQCRADTASSPSFTLRSIPPNQPVCVAPWKADNANVGYSRYWQMAGVTFGATILIIVAIALVRWFRRAIRPTESTAAAGQASVGPTATSPATSNLSLSQQTLPDRLEFRFLVDPDGHKKWAELAEFGARQLDACSEHHQLLHATSGQAQAESREMGSLENGQFIVRQTPAQSSPPTSTAGGDTDGNPESGFESDGLTEDSQSSTSQVINLDPSSSETSLIQSSTSATTPDQDQAGGGDNRDATSMSQEDQDSFFDAVSR